MSRYSTITTITYNGINLYPDNSIDFIPDNFTDYLPPVAYSSGIDDSDSDCFCHCCSHACPDCDTPDSEC